MRPSDKIYYNYAGKTDWVGFGSAEVATIPTASKILLHDLEIFGEDEDFTPLVFRSLSGTYVNDEIDYLGAGALMGNVNMTSVSFSNATRIDAHGLAFCTSLTSYSLPKVTELGEGAFEDCVNLTEASFSQVTSIGSACFKNCTSLSTIDFPQFNTESVSGLFMGSEAFKNCSSLVSAYFSQYSGTIPSGTFQNCVNLSDINFDNCKSIANGQSSTDVTNYIGGAFENTAISTIKPSTFPKCTYIGSYAFTNCSRLTSVTLNNISNINVGVFQSCSNLSEITLTNCNYIKSCAFKDCTSLSSINLIWESDYSNKTLQLSERAFNNTNLVSINIDEINSYVGQAAFSNCVNLENVVLNNCTGLSGHAFESCYNLSYISIPKCEFVDAYVFENCSSLTSIDLPVCSKLGYHAFYKTPLSSVSFPNCTEIGGTAFYSCMNLEYVNLPQAITVGSWAFGYCKLVSKIILGDCEHISISAFAYCSNLMGVYLPSNKVCVLDNINAFEHTPIADSTYTDSFGSIYVNASLVNSYKSTKPWENFADRIVAIPSEY